MKKNLEFKVQSSKFNSGFTFVEAILYISIVTIIFSAIVPFSLQVIQGGVKSSIQQDVVSQARFTAERLKYEIRNATGINAGSSNFNTNLALNPAQQISLQYPSPNNPTLISVANGQVLIQDGPAPTPAIPINSLETRITSLIFTNNTSGDNKTKNLTFTLTIEARNNSERQEYKYTITQKVSAEIRNN